MPSIRGTNALARSGGGVVIVGGKPKPVGPWDPLRAPMTRDTLRALAIGELAESIENPLAQRALQRNAWKTVAAASDRALSGHGRER